MPNPEEGQVCKETSSDVLDFATRTQKICLLIDLCTRGVQKVRGPTKKENEFYDGTRCEGCDVIKTVPEATTTQSVLLFCLGCWLL